MLKVFHEEESLNCIDCKLVSITPMSDCCNTIGRKTVLCIFNYWVCTYCYPCCCNYYYPKQKDPEDINHPKGKIVWVI